MFACQTYKVKALLQQIARFVNEIICTFLHLFRVKMPKKSARGDSHNLELLIQKGMAPRKDMLKPSIDLGFDRQF